MCGKVVNVPVIIYKNITHTKNMTKTVSYFSSFFYRNGFFHMKLNLGNLFISVKKANVYPASKYIAIQ